MSVVTVIEQLADITLSKSFQRKVEACFLLSSKIAPFYREYALAGVGRQPTLLSDHILFLWSQYRTGVTVSPAHALRLEAIMPEGDDLLTDCAQSAVICSLHLTWYLAARDDAYAKGCIVNYFDNVDHLVLNDVEATSGSPQLTDILVMRSRHFRAETESFEQKILMDDEAGIISRSGLIHNMAAGISGRR